MSSPHIRKISVSIQTLNDDVALLIFGLLYGDRASLVSIANTCRAWAVVVKPILFARCTAYLGTPDDRTIFAAVVPHVRALVVTHASQRITTAAQQNRGIPPNGRDVIARMSRPQRMPNSKHQLLPLGNLVSFDGERITDLCLKACLVDGVALQDFFVCLPNLRHLSGVDAHPVGPLRLADTLESLEWDYTSGGCRAPGGAATLLDSLVVPPASLRRLNISVSRADLPALARFLLAASSLDELCVDYRVPWSGARRDVPDPSIVLLSASLTCFCVRVPDDHVDVATTLIANLSAPRLVTVSMAVAFVGNSSVGTSRAVRSYARSPLGKFASAPWQMKVVLKVANHLLAPTADRGRELLCSFLVPIRDACSAAGVAFVTAALWKGEEMSIEGS
jgi:hypothetical protein